MDTPKQQVRSDPAFRTFRICLDRPEPRVTILAVVRRVAAEQAASGQTIRRTPLPRRAGVFA
jgi:hypothetical protein